MGGPLNAPVLAVATDVVKQLDGGDALSGLWNLFTKCKASIPDGARLENISWRLWHREMARSPSSSPIKEKGTGYPFPAVSVVYSEKLHPNHSVEPYRPASPTSPNEDVSRASSANSGPAGRRRAPAPSVGQLICTITDQPPLMRTRPTKPPHPAPAAPAPPIVTAVRGPAIAVISAPASLMPPGGADALFPRVVVVNPTPHPTPPATPLTGPTKDAAAQRPISPGPALPPPVADAGSGAPSPEARRRTPAPLAETRPAEHSASFFLPPTSPLGGSGSSGGSSSVLALIATPEGRSPAPLPPPARSESPVPRPELAHSRSPDPQAGTSVVSQSSLASKGSAAAGRKTHMAGKGAKPLAKRAGPRPGLARKHSSGAAANTGKTSMAAGAIRRSSSTANAGPELSILQALTALPEKPKKRPPPVQTDVAPAPAGPPSAKSPRKGAKAVPPSPLYKPRGAPRAKAGAHGKAKRPAAARSKSATREAPESDTEPDVPAGADDDEGWDDLTPAELAAQAAAEREAERARARAAEEERRRDYFRKRPASEYEHLARTRSTGLLSQLLKPDPNIFPPEHPYRRQFSTDDLARFPGAARPSALGAQLRPMTAIALPAAAAAVPARTTAPPALGGTATPAAKAPPAISRASSLAAIGGAAPSLKLTKSAVALPAMTTEPVAAPPSQAALSGVSAFAAVTKAQANIGERRAPPKAVRVPAPSPPAAVRARGAPADVDLETDTEDESSTDNGIQVARSVAQQRLAAFGRRASAKAAGPASVSPLGGPPKAPAPSPSSLHAGPPAPPSERQLPTNPPRPRVEPEAAAPIPVGYPYHLPLAPPPTSPRTQRRHIVQAELSESLRRELLKEHKVNRAPPPRRQGVLGAGGALRPLTALERTPEQERRERHLERTRQHADDFHSHGW